MQHLLFFKTSLYFDFSTCFLPLIRLYHLSFLHEMQGRMRHEAWVKHALGAWHSSAFIKIRLAFVGAARAASDLRAGNKHTARTSTTKLGTTFSFTRCNPFVFSVPRGLALCTWCIFLMYINVLYCSPRLHLCILETVLFICLLLFISCFFTSMFLYHYVIH